VLVATRAISRTALYGSSPAASASSSAGIASSALATFSRSLADRGPYPNTRSRYSRIEAQPTCFHTCTRIASRSAAISS
jgi:hypothetical protein